MLSFHRRKVPVDMVCGIGEFRQEESCAWKIGKTEKEDALLPQEA